ncbi:MAG: hypothetical protein K9N05_08300, partial [Candidatus Marinimicrobia bacterium]|nr:hypothetical protein [Candidatus Neomarinimicrobiota bacterium]
MKTKSVLMVAKKSALAAAFCFYAVFLFADVSNEGTNLSDLLSMKNKINHIHDAGDRSLPYRMMPVSMSDVKQRLDQDVSKSLNEVSETWEYYANNLYTYDADGNMTIYLFQIWDDSTGQWQDHEKNISNYDDQNHLLNETIHIWEEDAWLANYGVSYTYDMNDNVIESRTYYASDDTLELSGRTRFVYNGSGKMTERYDDSWVDSSGTWTESSKAELLYDLAGNNISYTQYYWYEGAWDPSHRTQMTYDEQGRMTLDVYSYWNGSEWLNTSKQEMIYSDGPDADEVIRYYWDGSGSTWVASQKDINTYDAKGNLVISINHIWDSDWI